MKSMTTCNYIVGTLGAVIGGSIMYFSTQFPLEFTENGPGPGFWPFALGMGILLCAMCLLIYTVLHKRDLSCQLVKLSTPSNMRVYMMMGIVVAFCVLLNLVGFYLAAVLLIPAVMLLMDYHDKKVIALTTIGTIAFIYLVFGVLLRITMPQSIFLG